ESVFDYLLWFAKRRDEVKVRSLFAGRSEPRDDPKFNTLISPSGEMKRVAKMEPSDVDAHEADGWRWARVNYPIVSQD
ncbi:hypothetical protein R0K05_25500, partial [Planococcus sp. SIMBA_160]